MATLIPTFRRTAKIERQNTEESIGYDVTNRNITSLQCPIFTPMTYGHERKFNDGIKRSKTKLKLGIRAKNISLGVEQ